MISQDQINSRTDRDCLGQSVQQTSQSDLRDHHGASRMPAVVKPACDLSASSAMCVRVSFAGRQQDVLGPGEAPRDRAEPTVRLPGDLDGARPF
jgi:hypothetical protein